MPALRRLRVRRLGPESQVFAVVEHHADLLQRAVAAVAPQPPSLAVEDRVRLVTGVVVPLVAPRADDRVGRMTLPVGEAVPGAGEADLGMGFVAKANVEHQIPAAALLDLASGHLVLFPIVP